MSVVIAPPFDTIPALRLAQRDDGAGINGHARIAVNQIGASTSEQTRQFPRIAQNRGTYR